MKKTEIKRQSPVSFAESPKKTELRNHWEIALEYPNESSGQYIVDLSHVVRWDAQAKAVDKYKPLGIKIPTKPGNSIFSKNILINRMNGIQASIWQFKKNPVKLPKDLLYTDTTDNAVAVAIFGDRTFKIIEKLSSLDFIDPTKKSPFLLQGPFSHVPSQIVVFQNSLKTEENGIILTCSRGYGHALIHAILEAGEEYSLQPAGENKFNLWLKKIK